MIGVLIAPWAVLLELHAIRVETLVFLGCVVPHFAAIASEDDDVPHRSSLLNYSELTRVSPASRTTQ